MKFDKRLILIAGIILTVLALVLAYGYHYKHFYEFLVLGLFLILYGPVGDLITAKEYKQIALKFFKAGLAADLLIGVTVTHLWHYNYKHLADYFPIYAVVYPVAGLVMLQSYVLVKDRLLSSTASSKKLNIDFYSRATKLFIVLTVILLVACLFTSNRRLLWPSFFVSIAVYVLLAISYRVRISGGRSLFDEIFGHPFRLLLVILGVSYFNALLHEVPNVTAQQWTYTNWPLQSHQIFGIPILVLVGWPFLTLYPAAVYYSVKSKAAKPQSLFEKIFPFTLPPKT